VVDADFKHRLQRFEAFCKLVHRNVVQGIALQMVLLEKHIAIALHNFSHVLFEQISGLPIEIYKSSGRLSVMIRSRGKLALHNVESLKSRIRKCLAQLVRDVLFEALPLVVENCGEAFSISFEEHVVETTSVVFVKVERSLHKGLGWSHLSQQEYCYVLKIQKTGQVGRCAIVFVFLPKQFKNVVLVQSLAALSEGMDEAGDLAFKYVAENTFFVYKLAFAEGDVAVDVLVN
jgi:hypothetical protein